MGGHLSGHQLLLLPGVIHHVKVSQVFLPATAANKQARSDCVPRRKLRLGWSRSITSPQVKILGGRFLDH